MYKVFRKSRLIETDKRTYDKYVSEGYWKPLDVPKYYKLKAASIDASCKMKSGAMQTFKIIITNFYN